MQAKDFGIAAAAALAILPTMAAGDMMIAVGGTSEYRIVTPNARNAATDYAAKELQAFLRQATGAELPIVRETAADGGPAIWLGPTEKAKSAGLTTKARKMATDGVIIRSVGDDLVLIGQNDRGNLYSVYVFLERYLGVRFLARDCTVVPKKLTLNLAPIDYAYAPPFAYREILAYDYAYFDFAARQKLNGGNMVQVLGRPKGAADPVAAGVQIVPFVHSAAGMVPPSKYFATHPEYFSLVGGKRIQDTISGQLCYTNPDVLKICTDEALKYLRMSPEIAYVDISQNDAWPGQPGACQCEKCQAVVKEEGAESGTILRFVNAIADVVAKEFPDRFVETLAYQYSITAPKITKPRDNVVIRLCHHACYFHGIEGEELGAEFRKGVEDWTKLCKHVFVWHYGVNFWSYLAPNPNLVSLAKDVKYYRKHGINGLMLQANIQSPGGELAEMRQYLFTQLVWDPTQDPVKLRREFCKGYYGPVAPEALEFLSMMDEWGRTTQFHIPMNGWRPEEVTPPEVVAKALVILNKAYDRADDQVYRNRVEKLLLPFWYMQLSWPGRYGLAKKDGSKLVARAKAVMLRNEITTISEGGPNAMPYLADRERFFTTP